MSTLVIVDLQNDFCPGGALAVPGGDETVAVANLLAPRFPLVVATQDWHPANHGSFASNHPGATPFQLAELGGLPQVLWPAHCVQNTAGAAFHPRLRTDLIGKVFAKGTDPGIDSYSGFFDNGRRKATGLGDFLASAGAQRLFVLGLATDYCVRATALDARSLGFQVTLVVDGCRAVNLQPGDEGKAIDEMRRAGIVIAHSRELP